MSRKLLLADDSVTIQRVIQLTFSGEDVQVLTAGDGEEAIARIPVERPDIVLADIAMPKRSGYDVSAFVKGAPELSHIPVLLLAGAFEPVDQAKAQEVGCDGVLVKPFEPQHVVARVRELIDGAKGGPTQAVADVPRPAERLVPSRPLDFPDFSLPSLEELDAAFAAPRPGAPDTDLGADSSPVGTSLDDYFDRLDAAFSVSGEAGSPFADLKAAPAPELETPVLDSFTFADLPAPPASDPALSGLASIEATEDGPSILPTLDDLLAGMPTIGDEPIHDADDLSAHLTTFEALGHAAPTPMVEVSAPVPVTVPLGAVSHEESPSSSRSLIADAFTAFLAVEQGEPGAVPVRLVQEGGGAPVVTDDMVDHVARRVMQRLSLDASEPFGSLVRDVVAGVSERLVREEIDRIRTRA